MTVLLVELLELLVTFLETQYQEVKLLGLKVSWIMTEVQMVEDLLDEILWYVWQGLRTCRASHTSVVQFITMVGLARKSSNALACPMMLWTHSAECTPVQKNKDSDLQVLCAPHIVLCLCDTDYKQQSELGSHPSPN